jgi:hypothetical protein
MGLEGGLTFNNGSGAVKPTKFFRETGYTFRTNLNWTE